MKILIAIFLGLPLVVACTSIATEKAQSPDNHEVVATDRSIESMGAAFFKMMDTNDDGIVTKDERAAVPHQDWMLDFGKIDLDGNGKLSEAEYIKALSTIHGASQNREA